MKNLERFFENVNHEIRLQLELILPGMIKDMKTSPENYTEQGNDSPGVDIRLCVWPDDSFEYNFCWAIRTGDASYDQSHSPICGASIIGVDSTCEELLDELRDECLEHWAASL